MYLAPVSDPQAPALSSLVLSCLSHHATDSRPCHEYCGQLFHHHHLAGLQRRDHHELLQPNGRAMYAKFSGRRRRPGGWRGVHPWSGAADFGNTGKFLGGLDARLTVDSVTRSVTRGAIAGVARRANELPPLCASENLGRSHAGNPARPGCGPREHQESRHEWRRILTRIRHPLPISWKS
jgi:hypothetical protein